MRPTVLLLLTGDIRAGTDTYRKCAEMQKAMLSGCDVHTMMVTWHSSERECMFFERNFYRKYNISEMELDWVDSVYLIPNVDIHCIRKLQNGHPPMFAHMIKHIANSRLIASLSFDYVIRLRNSLEITFPNIGQYLRKGIFVPPQLWYPDRLAVNDSYFICDRESFFGMSKMNVDELVRQSWSAETLQKSILEVPGSSIGGIQEVSHFNQNGLWLIKDGLYQPQSWSLVTLDIEQAYKSPFYYT
jgi:hypothetical protein